MKTILPFSRSFAPFVGNSGHRGEEHEMKTILTFRALSRLSWATLPSSTFAVGMGGVLVAARGMGIVGWAD
jgi:hypothetical protein